MQGNKPALQRREIHDFIVQRDHVFSVNADGLHRGRVDGLIRFSTGRNLKIDALFHQRCRDDKNNQQNECEIEQRCDVDLGERVQCWAI